MARHLYGYLMAVLFVTTLGEADKYSDENRPYEFGFNIEGEQHRHEKKDENGLIEGEFGFLTADGVYHVTVYATDENGNFKILSTKNLRVKPFPTSRRQESKALPFPNPPQPKAQTQSTQQPFDGLPEAAPIKSCSGCSIPLPTQKPKKISDFAVVSTADEKFLPFPEVPGNPRGRQFVPQFAVQQGFADQNEVNVGQINPGFDTLNQIEPNQFSQQPEQIGQGPNGFEQPGQLYQIPNAYEQPDFFIDQPMPTGQEPGQLRQQNNQFSSPGLSKPMLISAQMKIVDSTTDVNRLNPGEQPGLPEGVTNDDMLNLLYTFNYTLGFHAHHEEGYTNGMKKGYYYITGRDGIRTRIDYVADDQGYHPKISTEVLDLLSEDVPKPETEKEEKYGLKGYEFKWLYFPPSLQ